MHFRSRLTSPTDYLVQVDRLPVGENARDEEWPNVPEYQVDWQFSGTDGEKRITDISGNVSEKVMFVDRPAVAKMLFERLVDSTALLRALTTSNSSALESDACGTDELAAEKIVNDIELYESTCFSL